MKRPLAKERDENVASRSLAEDLFMKFVAIAPEDRKAFVDRWNEFQAKAAHPETLTLA